MVASGGSGSVSGAYGAPGGTVNGYIATGPNPTDFSITSEVSQTTGFNPGIGANGTKHQCTPPSGAGGGYWGGKLAQGQCDNQTFHKAVS